MSVCCRAAPQGGARVRHCFDVAPSSHCYYRQRQQEESGGDAENRGSAFVVGSNAQQRSGTGKSGRRSVGRRPTIVMIMLMIMIIIIIVNDNNNSK